MPFVRVETSVHLAEATKAQLCGDVSKTCAELIGKPEAYVMVTVHDGTTMLHGGEPEPAAFVEVRSIGGLSGRANKALSSQLSLLVAEAAGVSRDRIYLNFVDVAAANWGHDGDTFG